MVPFKSEAQRRKFAEMVARGEITQEKYDQWDRETGRRKLPERLRPKKMERRKANGSCQGQDD